MKKIILYSFVFSASLPTLALCSEHPASLLQEYRSSNTVIEGVVMEAQSISDADDPEGVARFVYKLKVIDGFKNAKRNEIIAVTSENTSARFPMDVGKKYLLFLSPILGRLNVNSCGYSNISSRVQKYFPLLGKYAVRYGKEG